jgi:hypothetical protein
VLFSQTSLFFIIRNKKDLWLKISNLYLLFLALISGERKEEMRKENEDKKRRGKGGEEKVEMLRKANVHGLPIGVI